VRIEEEAEKNLIFFSLGNMEELRGTYDDRESQIDYQKEKQGI
jgi:hypothetical protein